MPGTESTEFARRGLPVRIGDRRDKQPRPGDGGALAGAGLRVAVAGRSGKRAAEVADRLPGTFGVELDVRDVGSVARAIGAAWSRLDGIDLLVNNAGIGMRTVNRTS